MIISGLTYHGLSGFSIDKAFYNEMLADTDFQTHRPDALQKMGNKWSIPVSQEKSEKKKILSKEYFSSVEHGQLKSGGGPTWRYYYDPINPFMWSKNENFTGDDVPTSQLLIGPAKFTPPRVIKLKEKVDRHGEVTIISKATYPSNDLVHIWESIFKTILKNEFDIGTWPEFNKIIALVTGLTTEDKLDTYKFIIDTEKLFKYALECEYLIKKPT